MVTFMVGAGVGSCSILAGEAGTVEDVAPTVPAPARTKTVVEYKERKVEAMPGPCRDVLDNLKGIKANEGELMDVFIRGSDALSDGHEALTMKDGNSINEAREKLYKLDNTSNDSAQRLRFELWPLLERNMKACKGTDAYKGGE